MIRNLRKEDFYNGFLATLSNLSIVNSDIDDDTIDKFISSLNDNHTIFIYEKEGTIIGSITCLIEQKFIHDFGRVAHIEDVVVHKDYLGSGIAKQLIEHACSFAKNKSCYKIILNCNENLIDFYKKQGFSIKDIQMRKDL